MRSDDITVPTGGTTDTIKAFLTDPKFLSTAVACLIVCWVVVKVWRAIPKGVLVPLVVMALILAGVVTVRR